MYLREFTKNQQEILARLRNGDKFTGKNGCFTGTMTPLSIDNDMHLKVRCEIDGAVWEENWNDDILYTLFTFEDGDYYFI